MIGSFRKFSGSIYAKILLVIIIIPFVFWGMGSSFTGGSKNVVVVIDKEKYSIAHFRSFLRSTATKKVEAKDIDQFLFNFISEKLIEKEIEHFGIKLSDNSLAQLIKHQTQFKRDNKFSRTEYEKFLIKSGVTAPQFEANIVEQEKRRQFLSSLAGGIVVPEVLAEKEFRKENQIKKIKYIDLNKYHSKNKPSQESIKELYERNKNMFITELKSIRYAEIKPELISGSKEYNENFFKQLDVIENNILDGQPFEKTAKINNLKIIEFNKINAKKENEAKSKIENLPDNLFKKIFNIKLPQSPEVINTDSKYYLAEIKDEEKRSRPMNDPEVLEALNAQLSFKEKIDNNTSLAKDISLGAFDGDNYKKFADENGLVVENYKISSLKQNDIFSEGLVKQIFLTKDGDINLLTNSTLTKSFLISTKKTEYKKLDKNSNEFEQYEAKARLNLINKIYQSYDENANQKYKVEVNQRTIDRVKNSFQ